MSLAQAIQLPPPSGLVSSSSAGSSSSPSAHALHRSQHTVNYDHNQNENQNQKHSLPQQAARPSAPNPKDISVFEFTKRKRWADLLITELSEAILLVLSPAGRVWYCGAAVADLLGWREEELVDGDLADLMNVGDRAPFRKTLHESTQRRRALLAYVRLQRKNEFYMTSDFSSRPREVLFEITGRPHVSARPRAAQEECVCVFAVAKPYPSRNTAMLNTFLELKMENERLQQRLVQLRTQAKAIGAPYASPSSGSSSSGSSSGQFPSQAQQGSEAYYSSYEDMQKANYDGNGMGVYAEHGAVAAEEDSLDGPRKKVKRPFAAGEQYVCVTCGRTDSPEWRKGPLGPKTLCNACGLRWAKKVRTDKSEQLGNDGEVSGSLVF